MTGFFRAARRWVSGFFAWLAADSADSVTVAFTLAIATGIGLFVLIGSLVLERHEYIGLAIFLLSPVFALAALALMKGASSMAGGLYHSGSTEPNHPAIVKGMYGLAAGYVKTGQFGKARDKYLEILQTYPDELDARYLLANLLDQHFGLYEAARDEYIGLRRAVLKRNVNYPYLKGMEARIAELTARIKEEKFASPEAGED